jgi:hypothetical protein
VAADAVGVERRGRPHVVWLPQWVAATGEEEEVARRRWFEFVRESPCERMGQRVAEVGTGYGKASDGRRPGGQEARTRVAVAGSARGRQEVSVYTGHLSILLPKERIIKGPRHLVMSLPSDSIGP